METAKTLLALLGSRNIRLYLDDGKLKTQAAPGAISEEIGALIKAHRDELIAFLAAGGSGAAGIPKGTGSSAAVTSSQRRLWLSQKLSDAAAIYNVPLAVNVTGALDVDALGRALSTVIARHQALRTLFVEQGGEVVARLSDAPLVLNRHRLHASSGDAAAVRQLVAELAARPFDLAQDLLLRADLIHVGAEEHVLVLCMHHIAADGWSCAVLIKELEALYNGGDDVSLPALPIQFADYAEWLIAPEQQRSETAHLDYWREQLHDLPAVHGLALDYPRPRVQSYDGAELEHAFPETLAESIRTFARQQGTTVYCVLQAALALLLGRWSNEKDILIGTSSSGRTQPELEKLVGFFVNPLILRNRIVDDASVIEYLGSARRVLLEAFEHQQIAFERIVDEVLPTRSASHSPIFQFMFDYHGADVGRVALNGLDCRLLPLASAAAKYDIEITATELPARLHLRWVYATKLFAEATIRRLQKSFEVLVTAFIATPDARIAALPFLPPDEVAFIAEAGRGPHIASAARTLPERFAAVARRVPDEVAVEFEGETFSYAEIESRANKLAQFLRKLGLNVGVRAAVYLDPGPELVIAILAVLKAGGSYVPIDPAYPEERVEYILDDAATRIVLCSRDAMDEGLPVEQKLVPVDMEIQDVLFASQPDEAPHLAADEAPHIAYVLYTSGSTGKPKGAVIGHGALDNYLDHATTYFRDDMRGAIVSSSIGFDATITSLLTPLLLGKRVVLLRNGLDAVFAGLKRYLFDDAHAWLFKITPSHLAALGHECVGLGRSPSRHVLIIGGEQLDYSVIHQWRSRWLPEALYINEYGPTETVVGCAVFGIDSGAPDVPVSGAVPIGKPIANTCLYAVNDGRPVPVGAVGELHIAGAGLAEGYLNLPEVSAQRFVTVPHVDPRQRFYRTGDLVRLRRDGHFEFIRRCDDQVKIRGYRIEIGEIESALRGMAAVGEAAVLVQENASQRILVAFLQPVDKVENAKAFQQQVRQELAKSLPEYMVPSAFELIDKLPLTVNGKVDKLALPTIDVAASLGLNYTPPQSQLEAALCALWQDAIGLNQVGIYDNFLDIGGNSLMFVKLRAEIEARFDCKLDITAFFEYPTIAELARHLQGIVGAAPLSVTHIADPDTAQRPAVTQARAAIAVIAMAGRFPDADSPEALWHNVSEGREALQTFSEAELVANGFSASVVADPAFVRSAAVLRGVESFDAEFFRMTPREAEILDPQQRLLLECSVHALESAGYGDGAQPRHCGVFLGCGESTYLANHLFPQMALMRDLGLNVLHANSSHYVATRIAYKLDLTGPALTVATACSTSLVAVHQAVNSLRLGECDMALAGGAGVSEFGPSGYMYQEGGIESPDGRCHAFDADARGTRGGNGAGVVVLKRLDDALRDRDNVLAVIKGTALNNDGSQKAGYTAPSVVGQANVIEAALRDADLSPQQIQYVETHGTGTPLGDPIEYRALRKVFHASLRHSCALGTLKPNIGHLDAAAGIAGLIKAVQAVRHGVVPPCLNFQRPNELIDTADSPFYFNRQAESWPVAEGEIRRAGVSAFGIGGTNVHVVLEQAPALQAHDDADEGYRLIPLSAKSEGSLAAVAAALSAHLQNGPDQRLSDIAFTLQTGRQAYPWRSFVVANDHRSLAAALSEITQRQARHHDDGHKRLATVFLFPGQGAQYADMGTGLLGVAPRYTDTFERCRTLIAQHAGFDLRDKLAEGDAALLPTDVAQPALFALAYSLATQLISLGVEPEAMIGHSVGELVAACIAGVFDLDDAIRLVCARARLMQAGEPGAMLAVSASRSAAERFYDAGSVALAAVNGPENYVVSGPIAAIAQVEARLNQSDIPCRRLQTSHAFHSPMMIAAADGLREVIAKVSLNAPKMRVLSNVTGAFMTPEQACDPEYWAGHLLAPVQFAQCLDTLCRTLGATGVELAFVEVGPGHGLSNLVRRNPCAAQALVTPCMRHPHESGDDAHYWLAALGKLWSAGAKLDWTQLHGASAARRVALPTYPFERKRYWIERPAAGERRMPVAQASASANPEDWFYEDWFYLPSWQLAPAIAQPVDAERAATSSTWLVLADELNIATALTARMRSHAEVVLVPPPGDAVLADVEAGTCFGELVSRLPDSASISIACLWPLVQPAATHAQDYAGFERVQRRSFYPLLQLLQTIFEQRPRLEVRLHVVTDRALRVTGTESMQAALATLRGLCKVAAQENAQVVCRLIDIDASRINATAECERLAEQLWRELHVAQPLPEVALRGNGRWLKHYQPLSGNRLAPPRPMLRNGGHYVITGGLGRMGMHLAKWLAEDFGARISLVSRREFPSKQDWALVEDGVFSTEIAGQVRWLKQLEGAGAQVLVLRADVGDRDALAAAVTASEQAFGDIAGVFHAAGNVEDSLLSLTSTDEAACRRQFAPKVAGLIHLDSVLGDRRLDFCVVMSSLAAELGGLGFTAYAAANAYVDAFVQARHNDGHNHWCAIDWDGWNFSADASPSSGMEHTMRPEDGMRAFAVAMQHCAQPCLINSTTDIDARFSRWVGGLALQSDRHAPSHARPDISQPYASPSTQTEVDLVRLWQDLLGIDRIGIDDSFFELGGDSLIATRLVAKVRTHFNVADQVFSLSDFFAHPTISHIAARLEGHSVMARLASKRQELRAETVVEEGEF